MTEIERQKSEVGKKDEKDMIKIDKDKRTWSLISLKFNHDHCSEEEGKT